MHHGSILAFDDHQWERTAPMPVSSETEIVMAEITEAQKAELKRLSKEARVPDFSETVTTAEEAEQRIRDLKEKARME
jgi:hypothetical protein